MKRSKAILILVVSAILFLEFVSHADTITVPAGGNLQAALNAANCGDVIVVEAGATFDSPSQSLIVPAKPCDSSNPITVRSSAFDRLPSGRVNASDAVNMFRIRATTTEGAMKPARNSRHWKFIGMEVTSNGSVVVGRLIHTGTPQGGSDDPASWGDNFTFDRCYVHPPEDGTTNFTRTADVGFGWNGGQITITRSRISGFGGVDKDGNTIASGAFWSNLGGPYLLDNNYLAAQFNPIFLGAGENGSSNNATIQSFTPNSVTLSSVTNMRVGDKIALEVHLPSSHGYDFWLYGVKADGNTNTLTYAGHGFNNGDACYVDSYFDQIGPLGLRPKYEKYFIFNRTADTFQLAMVDGSVVDLLASTPTGGIKVGANGHQYANAEVTGINGNTVNFARLVRWEGDQHPESIRPYQYVISSEPPMIGGKAMWRGYQVHDFTCTHNTIDIDFAIASYVKAQTRANAKGYMEIKNLIRGLIEGNIFTGWPTSLALTNASQQSTSPWVNIRDLMIRNNLYESFSTMVIVQLLSGSMSDEGTNIQFLNNLGYNIRDVNALIGQSANLFYTAGGTGTPLIARHNTVINKPTVDGASAWLGITPMPNLLTDTGQGVIFEDNIVYYGRYGVNVGSASWATQFAHFTERKNVWIDDAVWTTGAEYMTGAHGHFPQSFYAAHDGIVGFTDPSKRDYSLKPGSPFVGQASDGKDIGVNMAVLLAAIGGAPVEPLPVPPLPEPPQPPNPPLPVPPVPPPGPEPPAPLPSGSRFVNGYLKVGGDYFQQSAVVTAIHETGTLTFTTEPGGYYEFQQVMIGAVLAASGAGYSFGPVKLDGTTPYFILDGVLVEPPVPPQPPEPPEPPQPPEPPEPPVEPPLPPVPPTPCSISAPASVSIRRNSSGSIPVTLNNLSGPTEVTVSGSDGQVTVSPLTWQAGPTSTVKQFSVKVKRQSRTITFQSPCGSVSVRVNVT